MHRELTSVLCADYALFYKANIPLAVVDAKDTRITALRRLYADLRQRLAERQSVQARLAEALAHEVA